MPATPTQAMCLLMAEIESVERSDHGKAREWTMRAVRAKRDPAWVADGFTAERWLPASPLTGRLDAFEWKEPPVALAGPILEHVVEQGFAKPAPVAAPVTPPSVAARPTRRYFAGAGRRAAAARARASRDRADRRGTAAAGRSGA